MYKHECYKIFTRKSIYVVFFLVILTMVYADILLPGDMTMKEEVYLELSETWGGPVTEEKIMLVREQMRVSDGGGRTLTFEDRAAGEVHYTVAVAGIHAEALHERKEALQGKLATLQEASYEYKEASKELTMLNQLGEPHGFYLIRAWRGMFDFIEPAVGSVFLATLIILGLTPVFADEYSKRTAHLILATKHGKRKIVTTKVMAALTYLFVVFSLLHIVNLLLQVIKFGGIQGGQGPMQNLPGGMLFNQNYGLSPYALEVWQFYAVTLTFQIFAGVALGLLVLLLSILTKNSMMTFFISGAVLAIPMMIKQVGFEQGILKYITYFNYLEIMMVVDLFEQFKAYQVLGYPILYPHMSLAIFSVITIIVVVFIYHRFRHQQVNF
ncbi:hypothetical protein H1D32_11890 [Anaerobacillus sp. CMMVII]|uniref:ABC transporter permease subunit n=1 Tax=Anaerobacillus sp. CMMVII TaxID=2755588 RepID=UPI0021B70FD1|nr:ABC transporter permease subunit [Anaerobacillus sp. CMMVII]MCT8138390.1 hypothetical protein [Anaerobacillus sp. CMMVII]